MIEEDIVNTALKLLKGYPFSFLKKQSSYIGDKMFFEDFMNLVEDGSVTDDDGCVEVVIVDEYPTNIDTPLGGYNNGYYMTFKEIEEIDGKVEIIWCNK